MIIFKAEKVLNDTKRAHELLESVSNDEQLFKLYWYLCVSLLRTIGEVLKNEVKNYPGLDKIWATRFCQLKALAKKTNFGTLSQTEQCDFLYWSHLCGSRRDYLVHEYLSGLTECDTPVVVCDMQSDVQNFSFDKDIYRPLDEVFSDTGYTQVENLNDIDCRDWIAECMGWWEKEIDSLKKQYFN